MSLKLSIKLINNEKGSLIVGAAVVAAVIGSVMVSVFSSGLIAMKQATLQVDEGNFYILNSKGLSLASYLISNNVVLCRHEGWKKLTNSKKCVWGGNYHDPELARNQFNIISDGYDQNRYYIEVSMAPKTKTKVFFDLANWEEKDNWSSLVGSVDEASLPADDDKELVLLTVITEGENESGTKLQLQKVGGIRRPIGTPEIIVNKDVNSGQCLSYCLTADSENPYPECRGEGQFDKDSFQKLNIKITNLGPGAIFRLGYQKNVIHDEQYFTPADKRIYDVADRFEIMGHDGVDVFMPGEIVEVTDTLSCAQPEINTSVVRRTQTGNNAGTTTETRETVFYDKFSTYYYDLSADAYKEVREPSSLTARADLANDETLSIIEPRKLGALHVPTELNVNKEIRNIVTIVTTTVPAPPPNTGDGDGDGDGGGDGDGCN